MLSVCLLTPRIFFTSDSLSGLDLVFVLFEELISFAHGPKWLTSMFSITSLNPNTKFPGTYSYLSLGYGLMPTDSVIHLTTEIHLWFEGRGEYF